MQKKQLIDRKPAYRHGQLLLEDDFIDEQQFLLHARYRQNLRLHGFGVASGLEVSKDATSVTIAPGFAIDRRGREIELKTAETLDLHGAAPGSVLRVALGYRTERGEADGGPDRRIDCFAVLSLTSKTEANDLVLATVTVNDKGRVGAVDDTPAHRDILPGARYGSITAEMLAPPLRRGWVSLAFHPSRIPEDEKDTRPPYRVGATRAMAHKKYKGEDNQNGAGGSMAIPLPPGIRAVHALCLAGDANEGKMTVTLVKGGITRSKDGKGFEHKREVLVEGTIGAGSYREVFKVPDALAGFNDPGHPDHPNDTLSVDIRSPGYSNVSLVAVEVSY